MPAPRIAAALVTAFLAAAAAHAATPAEGAAAFLLRMSNGSRTFAVDAASQAGLGGAALAWAGKAAPDRVARLAAVATPGSNGEARLVKALSKWTGEGRVEDARGAAAFLEDAAAQAEKLAADPKIQDEISAAVAAVDQSKAIERARQFRGRRIRGSFGPDRDPGALNQGGMNPPGGSGQANEKFSAGGGGAAGGANPTGGNPGSTNPGTSGAGGLTDAPVLNASSFRPALPASYKKTGVVPPLATVELNPSERAINGALSVINMEAYSRKGTLNRESAEGTQAAICGFLRSAKYDPGQAWSLALAARNVPGADPGDLDLRNAEHYLYAYSTTSKPEGLGDSTPVQLMMAVGWTPFKTVTKHVRPTSRPSLEEAKWGIKGAWHGQHPPDWPATCGAGLTTI